MDSYLKKIMSEISLNVVVSIITEEDLTDVDLCAEIVRRALNEGNLSAIRTLFERIETIFIFGEDDLRKNFVEKIFYVMKCLPLEDVIEIGKESVFGNIMALYFLIKESGVITPDKISKLTMMRKLKFIFDSSALELFPFKEEKIALDIKNEEINLKTEEIEEITEIIEWLFRNGFIVESKDTIENFLYLYKSCPSLKIKDRLVSSLMDRNFNMFIIYFNDAFKDICRIILNDEQDLIANYSQVYDLLQKANLPVFFDLKHFKFNKVLYNGNFFFAKILDSSGKERLLFPFEQIDLNKVQKIYDLNSEDYVIPKERIGKVLLQDIFSFKKVSSLKRDVSPKEIETVKQLSENEIEEKIRSILEDQNITPHGPSERADIFTTKLLVNNENDLRNAAFIIKGRGFPKISLNSIASNILKAVELQVDIIFLVYTGILLDEAQDKFIKQCNLNGKMYCIIDSKELAKLLVAYQKI